MHRSRVNVYAYLGSSGPPRLTGVDISFHWDRSKVERIKWIIRVLIADSNVNLP